MLLSFQTYCEVSAHVHPSQAKIYQQQASGRKFRGHRLQTSSRAYPTRSTATWMGRASHRSPGSPPLIGFQARFPGSARLQAVILILDTCPAAQFQELETRSHRPGRFDPAFSDQFTSAPPPHGILARWQFHSIILFLGVYDMVQIQSNPSEAEKPTAAAAPPPSRRRSP